VQSLIKYLTLDVLRLGCLMTHVHDVNTDLHLSISILPVRREILLGTLCSDLIGFHTYDYARHFLSSCTRILALPTMPNGVEFAGRLAHVGTFPIGIDPSSFIEVCLYFFRIKAYELSHKCGTEFEERDRAKAHQAA
jgi:hypothetical protein